MTTAPQTEPGDRQWKARLARAAARRARADAEFYATVAEIGGSVPQTQIATVLHTTQSNVSRWAARGREQAAQTRPGQLGGTAYEVAQRYAAGEITGEQMRDALIRWPYEPDEALPVEEWNITPVQAAPGSFEDTTGRAYDDGLLSAEDYDAILDGLADREPLAGQSQH
jgi:hypothetical protein